MDKSLLIHVAVLLGLTAVAVSTAQAAEPAPARQQELVHLVRQDCGSCHGMTLRGGLGPELPRSRMNAYSQDGLAALILHGVEGTAMPGWEGLLTEQEALWLADHLQNDNPLDE